MIYVLPSRFLGELRNSLLDLGTKDVAGGIGEIIELILIYDVLVGTTKLFGVECFGGQKLPLLYLCVTNKVPAGSLLQDICFKSLGAILLSVIRAVWRFSHSREGGAQKKEARSYDCLNFYFIVFLNQRILNFSFKICLT